MKPENIFSALSALRQEGRLRQVQDLRMETASLGVDREGKRYIVFNSNDYLGMTHAKEVQEAAAKAVRFGTGSGGARLTSGAACLLYTSPSPRDRSLSRMPSSA